MAAKKTQKQILKENEEKKKSRKTLVYLLRRTLGLSPTSPIRHHCVKEYDLLQLAEYVCDRQSLEEITGTSFIVQPFSEPQKITPSRWAKIMSVLGVSRKRNYNRFNVFTVDEAISVVLYLYFCGEVGKFLNKNETKQCFQELKGKSIFHQDGKPVKRSREVFLNCFVLSERLVGIAGRTLPEYLSEETNGAINISRRCLESWNKLSNEKRNGVPEYRWNRIYSDKEVNDLALLLAE